MAHSTEEDTEAHPQEAFVMNVRGSLRCGVCTFQDTLGSLSSPQGICLSGSRTAFDPSGLGAQWLSGLSPLSSREGSPCRQEGGAGQGKKGRRRSQCLWMTCRCAQGLEGQVASSPLSLSLAYLSGTCSSSRLSCWTNGDLS